MALGLWQRLSRTLRIGQARFLVGKDLAENTYYEMPPASGSTDPRHTRRVMKWSTWKVPSDYNPKEVPIQWDAWMRHTRTHPPSIEELVKDQERIRMIQHNAHVLAMREEQAQTQLAAQREHEHRLALEEQARREQAGTSTPDQEAQTTTVQPARRQK